MYKLIFAKQSYCLKKIKFVTLNQQTSHTEV